MADLKNAGNYAWNDGSSLSGLTFRSAGDGNGSDPETAMESESYPTEEME